MNRAPMSLRCYQRSWLAVDTVAGATLAAVAIPQTTGYTSIVQTPVVHRREQRWFERSRRRLSIEEARHVRLGTDTGC